MQRGVLRFGAEGGQLARRDAGQARGVVHLLAQRGDGWCLHTHRPSVSDMPEGLDGCQVDQAGLALRLMSARVCVVGSVNADLTFTVDALPRPGQTVLASSLTSAPGGKGGN